MKYKNFFFIHIPKTGGTFVVKRIPQIQYAKKYFLPTHSSYSDCKYILENKIPFTVVRNPYTWLESFYYFNCFHHKEHKRNLDVIKFNDFYSFIYNKGFVYLGKKQHEYLGKSFPKENILKTESLNSDLIEFFLRYGKAVEFSDEKVRVNENKRKIKWTDEMKNIVYDYYSEDFHRFGYKK